MSEAVTAPGGVVRSSPDSTPDLASLRSRRVPPASRVPPSVPSSRAPSDSSLPTLPGAATGEWEDEADSFDYMRLYAEAKAIAGALLLLLAASACSTQPAQPYRPDPDGWQLVWIVGLTILGLVCFALIGALIERDRRK